MDIRNFYVVCAITNTPRYKRRYELYKQFAQHVKNSGVKLLTVEAAFGKRPHEITNSNDPWHIQLRTEEEIWHKENLWNIGASRLPADWEYAMFADADIEFVRKDWPLETVQMLQHFDIIQPWSVCLDLNPKLEAFQTHHSFCNCFVNHEIWKQPYSGNFWHPGFAWAIRRKALKDLGGFIDYAILGSADHHMACALVNRVESSVHGGMGPVYYRKLQEWQNRANTFIRKNIGYANGTILHYWHGKKADRKYKDRWEILVSNNYDPDLDIKYDEQGLTQFSGRNPKLEYEIRAYFHQRNEDSIDFDPRERWDGIHATPTAPLGDKALRIEKP